MNSRDTIKRVLLHVLNSQIDHQESQSFCEICRNFSIATICLNKNRLIKKEILLNLDCTLEELAYDCIADLMERRDGKFIHIINYFNKKFPNGIENVHHDILTAHLATLVKSKTSQQISEIRESLGDHYFKIKKALSTFLTRKCDKYAVLIIDGIKYISLNHLCEYNFNLPQINENELLSKLLFFNFKNYNLATIAPKIFEMLQNQDEYCKAIREKFLLEILKEFYQIKQNDFLRKNVEYSNNEDFYDLITEN
ncbi:MAG: hypothetical protein ACYDA4_04225 [Ignavibacteriaceae bacterium]